MNQLTNTFSLVYILPSLLASENILWLFDFEFFGHGYLLDDGIVVIARMALELEASFPLFHQQTIRTERAELHE